MHTTGVKCLYAMVDDNKLSSGMKLSGTAQRRYDNVTPMRDMPKPLFT